MEMLSERAFGALGMHKPELFRFNGKVPAVCKGCFNICVRLVSALPA